MEIVAGIIAGGFIGAVLGFIGAGGAMITVPILLYIFDFTPQTATTAALAVVLTAAISGLLPKIKSKEVLFRETLIIWALGLTTNITFSILAYRLSNSVLTTGLALVLIIAGTSMLIKPIAGTEKKVPLLWLILISLVIGMITGLFGIGGDFLQFQFWSYSLKYLKEKLQEPHLQLLRLIRLPLSLGTIKAGMMSTGRFR